MRFSWYVVVVAVLVTGLTCLFTDVSAEVLNVTVTDSSGNPVNNAVVSAYSRNTVSHPPSVSDKTVIIDQVDKKFVNHVTPVQVGTAISFPNHDQIRHHVYSFSPVKTFEIPLYKGLPADPIVFQQEGVVTLGCNIHDWMSAYIVVIDSPFFATTDEQGHASLTLPVGDYELRFWHRDADKEAASSNQTIQIKTGQAGNASAEITTKSTSFSGRAPLSIFNRGRYR